MEVGARNRISVRRRDCQSGIQRVVTQNNTERLKEQGMGVLSMATATLKRPPPAAAPLAEFSDLLNSSQWVLFPHTHTAEGSLYAISLPRLQSLPSRNSSNTDRKLAVSLAPCIVLQSAAHTS